MSTPPGVKHLLHISLSWYFWFITKTAFVWNNDEHEMKEKTKQKTNKQTNKTKKKKKKKQVKEQEQSDIKQSNKQEKIPRTTQ